MEDTIQHPKKIAFMFLTINNMVKEGWWNAFFDGHEAFINIYNHAKFPKEVTRKSILFSHHTRKHIATKWADFSLVRATLIMMEEAIKDPCNVRFVLCSDSCVPIRPFQEFYNFLLSNDITLLKFNPNYKDTEDSRRRYIMFQGKHRVPRHKFKKQHQWCVFNRKAVIAILENYKRYVHEFLPVFASDEHFFINLLSDIGIPYRNYQITFVHFETGDSHPHKIIKVTTDDIQRLCEKGFFFMRKVSPKLELLQSE